MDLKKSIRPKIPSAQVNDNMTEEEKFQNAVIRPIVKMQHNILIAIFNHYLQHSDFDLNKLNKTQKAEFINTAISKNQHLRNQYIGIIIGMFTHQEIEFYFKNMSNLSKRIMQIIKKRVQDTF